MAKPYYFLTGDPSSWKVYKHSGFSSTVDETWTNFKVGAWGLDYNYQYLYGSYTVDDEIYRYECDDSGTPEVPTVQSSFSSPSTYPTGTSWRDGNLYSSDADSDKIYKHSGFSDTISDSFSSPASAPFGLYFDGTNLYSSDIGTEWIYRHSGFSSTLTGLFSSPSTGPGGISFDGNNIYSSDFNSEKIYKHSGFSATVSDSFSSPSTQPIGVVYYEAPDREVDKYDSVSIVENIDVVVPPPVDVYDSISLEENLKIYLPFLCLVIHEDISVFDIFQKEGEFYITISELISAIEDVDFLVSPNLLSFDEIDIEEYSILSDISPRELSTYEDIYLVDIIEARRNVIDISETVLVNEYLSIDIKQYGVKIISPVDSSLFSRLTPEVSTIVSAGRITMPNSLNGDGTYGVDIDISFLGSKSKDEIGVMVFPVKFTFAITNIEMTVGAYPQAIPYMDSGESYYEHNKANGQMSSWTAGNLTNGNSNTFDHVAGMFPVAFWDIMGQSSFLQIRLFAAMCYLCYDTSASSYKKVYSIGNKGVEEIDYAVFVKNFNPTRISVCDVLTVEENVSLS